ncbi:MAG: efflux RND transporter permease subunit, partial [Pseudomonadota bacterium]
LGSLRRTLIIGLAIPLAILVTFTLMDAGGLTLNIMTLGGLALGVGMLVDNTIVMMENISRHQRLGEGTLDAPINAAAEVNSAIVAATSTILAAVLPFLFVTGLVGLLFRELIYTLSAAIVGSLLVALTLVPAYSARVHDSKQSRFRDAVDTVIAWLGERYGRFIARFIVPKPGVPLVVFAPLLAISLQVFFVGKQVFLPPMDEGRVSVSVIGDAGMQLDELEVTVRKLEALFREQPDVATVFTIAGGRIFGRSEYQSSNRSTLKVQLVPVAQRIGNTEDWVKRMNKAISKLGLAGVRLRMRVRGVRGVRTSSGDDDISLRVQGPNITELARIGDQVVARLDGVEGVRNLTHTYEENREELAVRVDRDRAADLGVSSDDINRALRVALDGLVVTDFLEGDRSYKVRLRLPRADVASAESLGNVPVTLRQGVPVRLHDVTRIELAPAPSEIMRDRQRRIVEISASLAQDASIVLVTQRIEERLAGLELPAGYTLYDQGSFKTLQQGRRLGYQLLALALFLVFVVMAVQYESLRNPVVILLGVPFTVIGVAAGLWATGMPLSMPIWLGLIMLAGIVVNNAIVLIEQIEIERERGSELDDAIATAARLRLRPILMTTLTTVVGMSPLALGIGEGSEMLQPLAVAIVWGLTFSMLVTLILIPALYRLMHVHLSRRATMDATSQQPAA